MAPNKFKTAITVWLIILSIISIAALCRTFYRDVDLGVDYIGIIVGVLAALCTVLIGWQIYTLIDFNDREEKNQNDIAALRDILKGFRENGNRGDYLLYDNLSELCENILSKNTGNLLFERLHYKINAINYSSKIEQFDVCEQGIDVLKLFIARYDIALTNEQQKRLLRFACLIPNQNRIKNFTDLINAISAIKV